MTQMKHWQDPANALLGIWLVLSPWVIGFSGETTAMANAVLVGAALIAASIGATFFVPKPWEEWTEALLGLWLIVSPWALGFAAQQAATTNAFLIGFVIFGFSLWVLLTDRDWGWLRDSVPH